MYVAVLLEIYNISNIIMLENIKKCLNESIIIFLFIIDSILFS